jgi:virginiamycin B lyase
MLRANFLFGEILMPERINRKFFAIVALTVIAAAVSIRGAENVGGVLQGVVKDNHGAPVAGAFVKMRNAERRLTFMVISQAQGRYKANVPPGKYVVQGVGGEYQSPLSAEKDVSASRPATVDVALTDKRAPQLPNAWPGRLPGEGGGEAAATAAIKLPDGNGKQLVTGKCSACHDAARIANARYDRAHWLDIIDDMQGYAAGSEIARELTNEEVNVLLDYLLANFADVRGHRGRQVDANSRLPRTLLSGDATKYIAVEFELPNTNVEPHELTVDNRGNGWLTQRTGGRLGRFDAKTLTYTEFDPPAGATKKVRLNGIVRGSDNKLWFVDGGPNRRFLNYDIASETFNVFPLPKLKYGNATGNTMRVHPNGTVWLCNIGSNQIIRLDPNTKKIDVWEVPAGVQARKNATPYGMAVAGDGKVWFVENTFNQLGRIDPATGKFDEFPIPWKGAVTRKMGSDSEGNIWVGLHVPGKLMKVDYKTAQMTIFDPPTKDSGVYSVQGDPKSKLIWMSQQHADQIARFDPLTQTFTEFPLANAEEDHRRIEIDPTNSSRIWWTGNTSGRIGYVELLK